MTPPLAIVAATSAIWTGVAVTRAWPKAAEASSASSMKSAQPASVSSVTDEAETGIGWLAEPIRRPSQKPNAAAPVRYGRWPISSPTWAK